MVSFQFDLKISLDSFKVQFVDGVLVPSNSSGDLFVQEFHRSCSRQSEALVGS